MSALEQAWSVLKNEDIFRKPPILGHRILTPIKDDLQEELARAHEARIKRQEAKLAEEHEARIKRQGGRTVPIKETDVRRPILGNRILIPPTSTSFSQRATGDNNTQISAGGNVRTNLPQEPSPEPSPMDLAMEEIRAAQRQREEHAKMFEQMMGGAFRDATGRMITGLSEEARDYIGMLMANGIGAEEAENIARNELGE